MRASATVANVVRNMINASLGCETPPASASGAGRENAPSDEKRDEATGEHHAEDSGNVGKTGARGRGTATDPLDRLPEREIQACKRARGQAVDPTCRGRDLRGRPTCVIHKVLDALVRTDDHRALAMEQLAAPSRDDRHAERPLDRVRVLRSSAQQ